MVWNSDSDSSHIPATRTYNGDAISHNSQSASPASLTSQRTYILLQGRWSRWIQAQPLMGPQFELRSKLICKGLPGTENTKFDNIIIPTWRLSQQRQCPFPVEMFKQARLQGATGSGEKIPNRLNLNSAKSSLPSTWYPGWFRFESRLNVKDWGTWPSRCCWVKWSRTDWLYEYIHYVLSH